MNEINKAYDRGRKMKFLKTDNWQIQKLSQLYTENRCKGLIEEHAYLLALSDVQAEIIDRLIGASDPITMNFVKFTKEGFMHSMLEAEYGMSTEAKALAH